MIDPAKLQEKVLEAIMDEMDDFDAESKGLGGISIEIAVPKEMVDPKALKKLKKMAKEEKEIEYGD